MKKVIDLTKIKFLVSDKMRYDDLGDYLRGKIISYNIKKKEYVQAILLHEFIEYVLIKSQGIPVKWIDTFDTDKKFSLKNLKVYEKYRISHYLATLVERQFIENLGLDWNRYEKYIRKIKIKISKKGLKYKYED